MINILTADVYNRIAAGEVVDRPYSVVKELVENAVDAGANEITVEIEQGGKSLIRVSDNGSGISREDLPRVYMPHATSKLKTADELACIATLGFRGEAVASIASVSKMSIVSRVKGCDAYALKTEGGATGEVEPAAGDAGTVIAVESLFYNTPARLKFLKSDAQEESDITNIMARFILSRPEIRFTYYVNGKVRYRSFGDGLSAAVANVYGAEAIANCYEIDADKHGIRVRGYIGNQNYSKPNRSYQSLFVNGRYVVNQTVGSAIANAYASYLMKRQYPFYVLFLDLPPEIVDVNVHPNKADVRFADNQIIYGSVYSVVSAVLDGNSRALEYLVKTETPSEVCAESKEKPTTQENPSLNPASDASPQMSYAEAKKQLSFDLSPSKNAFTPRFLVSEEPELKVCQPSAEEKAEDVFAENQRFLREKALQERIEPDNLVYKGELFQTYLIYETGDVVYLIDQHAAHERLIYNRLKQKLETRTVTAQPMLVPYVLNVNAQEFAFLSKQLPYLAEMGFEAEEFGDNSIRVSAVPAELKDMTLDAFFNEILSSMDTLRAVKLAEILKDKLATAACKAAVKGGERLTDAEARALIEEADGDMGLRCPHGRPVAVKVKRAELEKLFKRIV